MSKQAICELSIDTRTLELALRGAEVGQIVKYSSLSELIKRDVRNGAMHLLASARRRLQRDHQMVFDVVAGVGLKRLDDRGIANCGGAAIGRIHNISRRALQKSACVQDFDALPNEIKVRLNTDRSLHGMLAHATRTTTVRRLEGIVSNGKHDALPTAKFLEAMREVVK